MVLDGVVPTDEDKKVRRNLVAFSASIFLLAWLGVPLSAVTEKAIGASLKVDPLRAWTAGAGVLLYLAVRFHFSGGGKAAFQELGKLWLTLTHWELDALMKRELTIPSHRADWSPTLSDAFKRAEEYFLECGYSGERTVQPVLRQDTSKNEARWVFSGDATLSVEFLNSTMVPPTSIVTYTEKVQYAVPFKWRLVVSAKALWGSWLYSEQAIAWMVPIWLALTASFIVGYRLGQLGFPG